jgi:integrase/recombinase XerD
MAAWLTGCRQNELVMAKWDCFDPDSGRLQVIGKGNKRRVISLSPVAFDFFKNLPKNGEYIFPKSDGRPYTMAASDFTHVRRAVRAKMAKQGRNFTGHRFHDLRHLFAVEALKGGMSIYDLQKHMGHSSIKVTEMYLEFLTLEESKASKSAASPVIYTQNHTQNFTLQ